MPEYLQSKIRVTGHLRDQRGIYQMELSWKGADGEKGRSSKSTGLKVKGNKKRAEEMLYQHIKDTSEQLNNPRSNSGLLFADYMEQWLETMKPPKLRPSTYSGYQQNVKRVCGYFRPRGILLKDLTAEDINAYYDNQLERVKAITVLKDHANISKALKYAVKSNKIPHSVMDKVNRPSPEDFIAKPLKESEMIALFEAVAGHKLELAVIMGAFYGLRRSEVVGLRWSSIDFDANSLSIDHTVTRATRDGKNILVAADMTKSKSSRRTLPLIPCIKSKLLAIKAEQEENKKLCGRSYNHAESEYVYTDPLGNRIKPDAITESFPKFLEQHGLRRVRFHDLRHSSASLLLANGIEMKYIQDWLGHSDFTITANIYAHAEFKSKVDAALSMTWINKTSLGREYEQRENDSKTAVVV